jgi:hypothetical protein
VRLGGHAQDVGGFGYDFELLIVVVRHFCRYEDGAFVDGGPICLGLFDVPAS